MQSSKAPRHPSLSAHAHFGWGGRMVDAGAGVNISPRNELPISWRGILMYMFFHGNTGEVQTINRVSFPHLWQRANSTRTYSGSTVWWRQPSVQCRPNTVPRDQAFVPTSYRLSDMLPPNASSACDAAGKLSALKSFWDLFKGWFGKDPNNFESLFR